MTEQTAPATIPTTIPTTTDRYACAADPAVRGSSIRHWRIEREVPSDPTSRQRAICRSHGYVGKWVDSYRDAQRSLAAHRRAMQRADAEQQLAKRITAAGYGIEHGRTVQRMTEEQAHQTGAHDDVRSTGCPICQHVEQVVDPQLAARRHLQGDRVSVQIPGHGLFEAAPHRVEATIDSTAQLDLDALRRAVVKTTGVEEHQTDTALDRFQLVMILADALWSYQLGGHAPQDNTPATIPVDDDPQLVARAAINARIDAAIADATVQELGYDVPVEPFSDAERAEIARITRDLRAAVKRAGDDLDRLPFASDAERNATIVQIVRGLDDEPPPVEPFTMSGEQHVEPFTVAERAEIARVTRDLQYATAGALDLIATLNRPAAALADFERTVDEQHARIISTLHDDEPPPVDRGVEQHAVTSSADPHETVTHFGFARDAYVGGTGTVLGYIYDTGAGSFLAWDEHGEPLHPRGGPWCYSRREAEQAISTAFAGTLDGMVSVDGKPVTRELRYVARAASRHETVVEPDSGQYHRAVRVGTLTIGYIAARGRQAWIAWDERFRQIETSGDAHQGMWYTAGDAQRAVDNAFIAAVQTGTFNPKGA